jgi:thioredoxin-dependent peroxiredoxin
VGVSADQVDRLNEFDTENDLRFPLLSDPDRAVARQFGVRRLGFLPSKRATFVIGTHHKVMAVITSETSMNVHADKALEVLRAAA